jgi:hypothetical protein
MDTRTGHHGHSRYVICIIGTEMVRGLSFSPRRPLKSAARRPGGSDGPTQRNVNFTAAGQKVTGTVLQYLSACAAI